MIDQKSSKLPIGRWTRTTFLGWLVGVVLIIVLSSFLDSIGIEHMQFYIGIGMGTGVGLTQWMLLRKLFAVRTSWIWASIVGMGLPFILLDLVLADTFSNKLPLSVALGGITTGILQYRILKNHFQKASHWIIGCSIAWILATVTVLTVDYTMTVRATGLTNLLLALLNLSLILSGGLILGIITGMTFKKMEGVA